jgi:hypothetical protein
LGKCDPHFSSPLRNFLFSLGQLEHPRSGAKFQIENISRPWFPQMTKKGKSSFEESILGRRYILRKTFKLKIYTLKK